MKIEKFKVLLYLKKSGMDKNGKAPIMGRITVNRTMAQFSCKLSCTPSLWNPRASRLEGKSKEAVETNKDIEQLLLSIQKAFDVLVEKRTDFEAKDVKEALQGSVKTQTTLLSFVDEHISELSTHEGIDMSKSSVWTYRKIRKNLAEFIGEKYRLTDLAFGQLTEPFISDFHHYLLDEKGFSSEPSPSMCRSSRRCAALPLSEACARTCCSPIIGLALQRLRHPSLSACLIS